jgi:hypothetical protein
MSDPKKPYDEDACWDSYEDELRRHELMSNGKGGRTIVRLKPGRGAKFERSKKGLKYEDFIISVEED